MLPYPTYFLCIQLVVAGAFCPYPSQLRPDSHPCLHCVDSCMLNPGVVSSGMIHIRVSNWVKAGKEEGSEKIFLMAVSLKIGTIAEVKKVARGIQMGDFRKKGRPTSEIFIRKRVYFPTYFDNFRVWVGRRMGIFPARTASLQTTTAWTGPRSTWYNPSNTLCMDSAAPSTDPTTATATSPSWDQVRTYSDTLLGLDFI